MRNQVFNESSDKLYSRLSSIYNDIIEEGKIEVFGDLDFQIVSKIDRKNSRVAKIKDNKIIVKINAVNLSDSALRYIIAHELAHIATKGHTNKFWKIVETIYPEYEKGHRMLMKQSEMLSRPFLIQANL